MAFAQTARVFVIQVGEPWIAQFRTRQFYVLRIAPRVLEFGEMVAVRAAQVASIFLHRAT